jgi:hypothetical protein
LSVYFDVGATTALAGVTGVPAPGVPATTGMRVMTTADSYLLSAPFAESMI